MSKDKTIRSKDKTLEKSINMSRMVQVAMDAEEQTEKNFFTTSTIKDNESKLQVIVDYQRAYELALASFVNLSETVDMLTNGNEEVRDAFINQYEELQEIVKMECVQLFFE